MVDTERIRHVARWTLVEYGIPHDDPRLDHTSFEELFDWVSEREKRFASKSKPSGTKL